MGHHLHRPAPGRGRRRPTHLQRPHHQHRHPLLPAPSHPNKERRPHRVRNPQAPPRRRDTAPRRNPKKTRPWVGPTQTITTGPNGLVILTPHANTPKAASRPIPNGRAPLGIPPVTPRRGEQFGSTGVNEPCATKGR